MTPDFDRCSWRIGFSHSSVFRSWRLKPYTPKEIPAETPSQPTKSTGRFLVSVYSSCRPISSRNLPSESDCEYVGVTLLSGKLPGREVAQGHRTDRHPDQAEGRKADRGRHSPHLRRFPRLPEAPGGSRRSGRSCGTGSARSVRAEQGPVSSSASAGRGPPVLENEAHAATVLIPDLRVSAQPAPDRSSGVQIPGSVSRWASDPSSVSNNSPSLSRVPELAHRIDPRVAESP